MSIFDPVFTDAIKDVIGNEPVVDEFDNYYGASFYGTLQDSFLTGALIVRSNTNSQLVTVFEAGTRGSAFNKFDAGSQPLPSDTTPGSFEAITFPNTSDRLQPWKEKVGLTYRTTQHFDDREKYYDTCLPSLRESLAADGTVIRTKSSENVYTPLDIPGLAAWYRADQEVYTRNENTPPYDYDAANDGDPVYQWKDISGNNKPAFWKQRSAPLAFRTPVYFSASIEMNRKPAIRWRNNNDVLTSSYIFDTVDRPYTISVAYWTKDGEYEHVLSDDLDFYTGINSSNKLAVGANAMFASPPRETPGYGAAYQSAGKVMIHTAQLTTAYAEQFLAGEIAVGAAGQANSAGGRVEGTSGNIYVGRKKKSTQDLFVSEIIIYERKLDRYELARLHAYLAERYTGSGNEYAPLHLIQSASAFSGYSLQPHGNFVTDKKGFILFNTPRSNDNMFDDPSTNNTWTWSYPYESRYNPEKRIIKSSEDNLKINRAFASMSPATASITPGLDLNPLFDNKGIDVDGIVPLLPGVLPIENLPSSARNGYRLRPNDNIGKSEYLPAGQNYDQKHGYSFLIPSDNQVVKPNSFPAGEYLSSSMSSSDLAKFLYGFGDLNTLTYYDQNFSDADFVEIFNCRAYTSSSTTLGTSITGTYSTTTAIGDHFITLPNPGFLYSGKVYVDYNLTSSVSTYDTTLPFSTPDLGWRITENTHFDGTYFISSSLPLASSPTQGVRWRRNGENGEAGSKIIRSVGSESLWGGIDSYSSIIFDVTSSLTWKLSYDRAISGSNDQSYFESVLLGKPGYPSKISWTSYNKSPDTNGVPHPSAVDAVERLDYVQVDPNEPLPTMERFTSRPFVSGSYRVAFRFQLAKNNDSRAFLDNIIISIVEDDKVITPTNRLMGGNNYPQFRLFSIDDRANPHSLEDGGEYTQKFYQSNIFAVSPVIRGWKYGLVSAFPQHTRAIFKRNKFGQFRDMLEQRLFTKTVVDDTSPFGDTAVPSVSPEVLPNQSAVYVGRIDNGPVEVVFVRQRYEANERSIGKIYKEVVPPEMTTSQNLSTEVTSSLPYFDGIARHRNESSMPNLKNT